MFLPNFFVIGAPKSGTTALCACLAQHPEIYMSPVKEPMYFVYGGQEPPISEGPIGGFNRRTAVWRAEDYARLFAGAAGAKAIGEGSTRYLRSADAAHRIAQNLPNSRIVAVLRHPADRAYSSYWFMRQHGVEPEPTFARALSKEADRIAAGWFPQLYHRDNGSYYRHLRVYYDLFPRERIKIYLYDDWKQSPNEMLSDLFKFLGVDPDFRPELRRSNETRLYRSRRLHDFAAHPDRIEARLKGTVAQLAAPALSRAVSSIDRAYNITTPPPLSPEMRESLTADYREDILQLQDLIGRDLTSWLA